MEQINERAFVNCEILIPWNDADPETQRDQAILQEKLGKVFENYFILNIPYLRSSIRSPDDLKKQLTLAIQDAHRRLMQRGTVHQLVAPARAGGGSAESSATVAGPTVSATGTNGGTV
jgi:hypothetical protein